MPTVTLHEGDNRDTLRRLIDEGVRVHSVVCDPPYSLTSITKRFGKVGSAPAKSNGATGVFARASGGFMGQAWDSTYIERDPEFWQLVYDILLPGGYCIAFSSPRTGHWMACAMEVAGFVQHPFLGWVYAQGMPKDHDAAKAIDRELGVEGTRGDPKSDAHAGWIKRGAMRGDDGHEGWQRPWMDSPDAVDQNARQYLPGTAAAAEWGGWAYGTQSLKPALEPIYVAQKPFSEKNGALNLLRQGVGAVNIDGCRVPVGEGDRQSYGVSGDEASPSANTPCYGDRGRVAYERPAAGRHPANLLHDGSDLVRRLFPVLGKSAGGRIGNAGGGQVQNAPVGSYSAGDPGFGDSGSAARFFNTFPMTEADYAELAAAGIVVDIEADFIRYQPKATASDRVFQCTECEQRFIGVKPSCDCGAKARSHPTVKPDALLRWLCRLVTPPGGTVLDPFAGSGTTGKAAMAEGFDAILMEADPVFSDDIRARFGLPVVSDPDIDALLFGNDTPIDAMIG